MDATSFRKASLRLKLKTLKDQSERPLVKNESQSEDHGDYKMNWKSSAQTSPARIALPGLVQSGNSQAPSGGNLAHLRRKIEEQLFKRSATLGAEKNPDSVSPVLARLRNTPGHGLRDIQKELIEKHEQIRQHSNKLNLGGGITLWPNMSQMRLSGQDIIQLLIACFILTVLTAWLFVLMHGKTFQTIWKMTRHLQNFSSSHTIVDTRSYYDLKNSLIVWHSDYRKLVHGISLRLNTSHLSLGYQMYFLAYIAGFSTLVYFLADNMLSKSKLSPGRIKKWVCLLLVIAQWTGMLCVLFISASRLEAAIVDNVYYLLEKMGELVELDQDLSLITVILQYWRDRCLPPTARGVVWVFGLIAVQDVTKYIQYYSLPLLTVLLTPVVKLCMALYSLYTTPTTNN